MIYNSDNGHNFADKMLISLSHQTENMIYICALFDLFCNNAFFIKFCAKRKHFGSNGVLF